MVVDDSFEDGEDNDCEGEGDNPTENGGDKVSSVGSARRKRPEVALGVMQKLAAMDDKTFHVEKMSDAVTAFVESITTKSGTTEMEVDASEERKLEKTNKILLQQADALLV